MLSEEAHVLIVCFVFLSKKLNIRLEYSKINWAQSNAEMLMLCSETPTCLQHLTHIPAQSRVERSQKACIEFLFSWLNINLFEVLWILIHHKCASCFFISFHLCVVIYFYRLASASTVLSWNICWNQVWSKNADVHCCCTRFNVTFFTSTHFLYSKSKCFLCAILRHSHIFLFFI